MTVQKLNQEQVDLLAAKFQLRWEPNHAAMGMAGTLLALPGLRGAWLMSGADSRGNLMDLSGQGHVLLNQKPTDFMVDGLLTYADFVAGSTDYFQLVGPIPMQLVQYVAGALGVVAGQLRIYNNFGVPYRIVEVMVSVGTAPAGVPVIMDVNLNGVSIFAVLADQPTIAVGQFTGTTTAIATTTWSDGDYFTVDVDQAGAAADLTTHILVART